MYQRKNLEIEFDYNLFLKAYEVESAVSAEDAKTNKNKNKVNK